MRVLGQSVLPLSFCFLAAGLPAVAVSSPDSIRPLAASLSWTDLGGRKYDTEAISQSKATVFFFTSTQCPVSNLYTNRLNELAKIYSPRDIRFFVVNSNVDDSLPAVQKYAKERKLSFPVVKDNGTELADKVGASVTPEAVILDSTGEVRYRGRIDDNKDREKVARRDVQEALDSILAGKPVKSSRTLPFGCAIFRDHSSVAKPVASKASVTYAGQVAGILNEKCIVCHRKGEVAPFALENYRQARTWAKTIKDYTARRIMPPWKPQPGYGDFHDQRYLSPDQIAVLARWADTGAPAGDLKKLPPAPRFPDPSSWRLGKPDLVLKPDRDYHLEAEGKDVYRNFVLPTEFAEDTYLSGMEFKPGNSAIVHHIVAYIDPKRASVQLDKGDGEPGYSVAGTGPGFDPAIWGDVWVPGSDPRMMPPGVGIRIPKGSKLVIQVHYHKTGKPETDRSQAALYYARGKPDRVMHTMFAGSILFQLKPGDSRSLVDTSMTIPADVTLHNIFPHMHMLGKEMKVLAKLPDGSEKKLVYINDWDFNWQATYVYKDPIKLPKGTRIELHSVYDNSDGNPRQHTLPPKLVTFGEQTTDEMCFCFFGVTMDGGEKILTEGERSASQPNTRSRKAIE